MLEEFDEEFDCDCGTCEDCDILYRTGYYPYQITNMAKELKELKEKLGKAK